MSLDSMSDVELTKFFESSPIYNLMVFKKCNQRFATIIDNLLLETMGSPLCELYQKHDYPDSCFDALRHYKINPQSEKEAENELIARQAFELFIRKRLGYGIPPAPGTKADYIQEYYLRCISNSSDSMPPLLRSL